MSLHTRTLFKYVLAWEWLTWLRKELHFWFTIRIALIELQIHNDSGSTFCTHSYSPNGMFIISVRHATITLAHSIGKQRIWSIHLISRFYTRLHCWNEHSISTEMFSKSLNFLIYSNTRQLFHFRSETITSKRSKKSQKKLTNSSQETVFNPISHIKTEIPDQNHLSTGLTRETHGSLTVKRQENWRHHSSISCSSITFQRHH